MKKLLLSTILAGSMGVLVLAPTNNAQASATRATIAREQGMTVAEVEALQKAGMPAESAAKELKAARDQVKAAGTTADSQELKVETFLEAKKNNVPLADIVNEAKLGNKAEDTVKNFVAGGGAGAGAGAGGGVKAPDPVKVHARSIIPGATKDDIAAVDALSKLGIPLNTVTAKQVDAYKNLARLKNDNGSSFAISLDAVNAYEQYFADTKVTPVIGEDLLAFIEIKKSPVATSYAALKTAAKDDYIAEVVIQFATHKDWTQAIQAHEAELAKLAAGAGGGADAAAFKADVGRDPYDAEELAVYLKIKDPAGLNNKNPKEEDIERYLYAKNTLKVANVSQNTLNTLAYFVGEYGVMPANVDIIGLDRAIKAALKSKGAPNYPSAGTPAQKLAYLNGVAAESGKPQDKIQAYEAGLAAAAAATSSGSGATGSSGSAGAGGAPTEEDAFKADVGRAPLGDELDAYRVIKNSRGSIHKTNPNEADIKLFLIAKNKLGIVEKDISTTHIKSIELFVTNYGQDPASKDELVLGNALVQKLAKAPNFPDKGTPAEKLTYFKGVMSMDPSFTPKQKIDAYEAQLTAAAAAASGGGGGAGALPADQQALRDSIAALPNVAGLLAVFDSDPAEFTTVRDATSAANKANPIYLSAKFLAAKTGITFSSTNGKTLMAIIRQFANEPRIVNLTKANFDAYAADPALVKTIDDLLK